MQLFPIKIGIIAKNEGNLPFLWTFHRPFGGDALIGLEICPIHRNFPGKMELYENIGLF